MTLVSHNADLPPATPVQRIKHTLAAGGVVRAVNLLYPAPGLAESFRTLGLDLVFIDCEKNAFSMPQIEAVARGARAGGVASFVRPWLHEPGLISRYLDVGADGVMVASIDDADTATRLVDAVRFARHHDFADKLVIGMIESPQALDNLDEILAVDGVDVWVVGANDLAHRLGFPGQAALPEVQRTLRDTLARIVAAGRVAGINVNLDTAEPYLAAGARFVITDINYLLGLGAAAYAAAASLD